MIIDSTNCEVGNKAMASVLLLYYHLLSESGITHAQTVYLDPADFNGFDFVGAQVSENENIEIDEALIREGAAIYLLCELNDIIVEYDEDFHIQPLFKRIVNTLKAQAASSIPEVEKILDQLLVPDLDLDYAKYNEILQGVYKKYVYGFFSKKMA